MAPAVGTQSLSPADARRTGRSAITYPYLQMILRIVLADEYRQTRLAPDPKQQRIAVGLSRLRVASRPPTGHERRVALGTFFPHEMGSCGIVKVVTLSPLRSR
jgi:hypothetical protein